MVLIGILLLAQLAAPAPGANWYIDQSVAEEGDGKSWQTAFKAVQREVDAASDGDTEFTRLLKTKRQVISEK